MKYLNKILVGAICIATFLAACDKADTVPYFANGTAPALSSSTATIAPGTGDTTNTVVTFSWTNPHYSTDSSTVQYILQIDTVGDNFANPIHIALSGSLSQSLTGNQVDSLVLINFGLSATVAYNMQARLISSYANNNEQYTSNTIAFTMTASVPPFPNVTPMPVDTPSTSQLWIVGDLNGWNNGGLAPQYQFTRVNGNYYTLTTTMGGAGTGYLFLLANDGDWSNDNIYKNGTAPSTGGYFGAAGATFGNNFTAPAVSGTYLIEVRFDLGYFNVIKLSR